MTEFITQHPVSTISIVLLIGVLAGIALAGVRSVKRCKECVLLRACAVRELKRMENEKGRN